MINNVANEAGIKRQANLINVKMKYPFRNQQIVQTIHNVDSRRTLNIESENQFSNDLMIFEFENTLDVTHSVSQCTLYTGTCVHFVVIFVVMKHFSFSSRTKMNK